MSKTQKNWVLNTLVYWCVQFMNITALLNIYSIIVYWWLTLIIICHLLVTSNYPYCPLQFVHYFPLVARSMPCLDPKG